VRPVIRRIVATMRAEAQTTIAASPDAVYDLVSDVTRMGEWSPETVEGEWIDGATGPAVGARFKGTNRSARLHFVKWSTKPRVVAAERGSVFAFDTGTTIWRYDLAPQGEGTRVVESFETHGTGARLDPLYKLMRRDRGLVSGMEATLARLKAVAEG
jgi:uncharacterized protein YndB with AHSA1/START domain